MRIKKSMFLLISILLVVILFFSITSLWIKPVTATADYSQQCETDKEQVYDKVLNSPKITNIKEEGNIIKESPQKLLQMKEALIAIEENFVAQDTNIQSELNKQINKYEKLIVTASSKDEILKIHNLISITQQLSERYEAISEKKYISKHFKW